MKTVDVRGVRVPTILYGTAWKEDRTEALVKKALAAGFRGFDTANQRKHYFEEGVGKALGASKIPPEDLFIQTKFTSLDGQDRRLPYDAHAPIAEKVEQSFESSLVHLGVETIDSFVLHGPSLRKGLISDDWDAWRAMEKLHAEKRARLLGISNVALDQLEALCAKAAVKPAMVQNRCYASRGWDREIRAFCGTNGIIYQGFSLLTANREILRHGRLTDIAKRHHKTVAQVIFRFALQLGMIVLTGTTSDAHMRENLAIYDFELDAKDVAAIETVAG